MLNEEICRLLGNIERELLEFVKFVKNVEDDYGKILPHKHGTSRKDDQKLTTRNYFEDKNDVSHNYALPKAFEIVKNVLHRMHTLLDEFSAVVTENERDPPNSSSCLVNHYYNQYLYQVVAYLLKILEENLNILAVELIQSVESDPQTEHKVSEPSDGKKPKLKFKFFKPATPFTQDDKIYKPDHPRNYKPDLKLPLDDQESDLSVPEDSEMSSNAEFECQFHKCFKCNRREHRKSVVFNCIMKSLNALFSVIEEVLLQIKNSADARPTEAKSTLPPLKDAGGYRPKHEDPCSCSLSCKECGQYFDTRYKESKCKNLKVCKKYHKEKDWHDHMAPKPHSVPCCMEKDPRGTDFKEYTDHDANTVQKKQIEQNHESGSKILENHENDPYQKAELHTHTSGRKIHSVVEKELPGMFSKSDSNERKKSEERDLPSEKNKPQDNLDRVSSESDLPLTITRDHRQIISSEEEPEATLRDCGPPLDLKNGSETSPINDMLNKIEIEDFTYPQTIVFDVKKFSQLLKEKLRSHSTRISETEGKSESKLLLDIVVTSFDESSVFNWEIPEKIVDRRSLSGTSIEASEEFDEKVDNAVDSFVDDIIRVSYKIAETETEEPEIEKEEPETEIEEPGIKIQEPETEIEEPKKIFGPQDESSDFHEDDSNMHTFSTGRSGDETVKIMFPEQSSDMGTKLRNVEPACISCRNMVETESTESDGSPEDSFYRRRRRKSITDTCFRCWNARQRGLAIHQCHTIIPLGVLEVRHMDSTGHILVCFVEWVRSKEPDDWRWQKNLFPDQTRVEIQEQAGENKDPVVRVIYGDEGNMIRESLAQTSINTVGVCSPSLQSVKGRKDSDCETSLRCDSLSTLGGSAREVIGTRYKKQVKEKISEEERHLATKLGRFYEEVLKFGYGKGPPLILKIRKKFALNDAHNLLMCKSGIRLHYYRNLRVIFVADDKCERIRSTSNFIDEDQSNELFDMFCNKLFGSDGYHLFDYPSEEAHFQYINPDSSAHPQWFEFAGAVLGLAFLHQKCMKLKISKCLFKCLLDRPLALQDLQSIDPLLYQKLMWLKENDITARKVKMSFVIQDQVGNEKINNELMVNGKKIAVTEKNKYRYIELAVKWKLAERCLSQLKDFRKGFASVIDPCFLTSFSERELMSIIKQPPEQGILTESNSGPKDPSRRGSW